uniref:Uncharacterized protein n=1 Tax=Panagrolaimus sp. ES5 TaxID=591445 RepID=A0AC34FU63_9BILA
GSQIKRRGKRGKPLNGSFKCF